MDFHGTIQKGRLTLPAAQKELRMRSLASMKDGTNVRETIVREGRNKTHQQIKTIFGLVIATIIQSFEDNGWDSSILLNTKQPTGVPVTKGLLKEYFYSMCPIENDEGDRITLSKATIEQAMKFIDNTRNWAASQWSIHIQNPDPNWREKLNNPSG